MYRGLLDARYLLQILQGLVIELVNCDDCCPHSAHLPGIYIKHFSRKVLLAVDMMMGLTREDWSEVSSSWQANI